MCEVAAQLTDHVLPHVADVTEALIGERVGRSTVSRVAKRLGHAAIFRCETPLT